MAHGPADGRPESASWADLRVRFVSALVLAPAAVAIVWLGGAPWTVLITLAAAWLACEWVLMCSSPIRTLPGIAVPLAMLAVGAVAAGRGAKAALLVVLAGFALTWAVAAWTPAQRARRPASLAAGVVYIGLACVAMIWLRRDGAAGRPNILFLLLIVWASDVGAYLAGRLLGGPLLAPRISPGKTWAGAFGGLLAAVGMGYAVAMTLAEADAGGVGTDGAGAARIVLVAACLGVASQIGDLLESSIKRGFGVKDSGRLIPGHGGLLDRVDGFLAAGPAAAALALALGPGVVLWR